MVEGQEQSRLLSNLLPERKGGQAEGLVVLLWELEYTPVALLRVYLLSSASFFLRFGMFDVEICWRLRGLPSSQDFLDF